MKCQVSWVDCNDQSTAHDEPAVVYAVLTTDKGIKKYPICTAHLQTLLKKVVHHDEHCEHPSQYPDVWTILPL